MAIMISNMVKCIGGLIFLQPPESRRKAMIYTQCLSKARLLVDDNGRRRVMQRVRTTGGSKEAAAHG
jgi:hypothetical protein